MDNYQFLYAILQELDEYISYKRVELPTIYLFGGTACILGKYLDRATTDFDIIDMGYSPAILKYTKLLGQVDFLDLNLTTVDLNFYTRALPIMGLNTIKVFTASKEDIITSKIGRYSEKDREDIRILIMDSNVSLIHQLCENIVNRIDLSMVLKEMFVKHYQEFKKEFLDV